MAKLSDSMVKGLRAIKAGNADTVPARTRTALRSRFLAKTVMDEWTRNMVWQVTPTGQSALDEIDRAERAAKEAAERKARPVPASAFVEPSARTAPVLGLEYDEDEPDVDAPAVPQAWVDQLVTLLDADVRIVKTDRGWRTQFAQDTPFRYHEDRLMTAATEAIRRGIAQALPPTPGQGVVRLALVKPYTQDTDPRYYHP